MTTDHAHEGAFQAFGEKQRTLEYKKARAELTHGVEKLYEAYQLGMVRTWGDFTVGKTEYGAPAFKVNKKDDHDRTERTVAFDELAAKQYGATEDEGAFVPQGQTSVIATFEDKTFNDTTHQFERIGWTVWGDGSVERLTGRTNEKGEFVTIGAKTNDVMDLHMANEYLAGVMKDTILPEPTDAQS